MLQRSAVGSRFNRISAHSRDTPSHASNLGRCVDILVGMLLHHRSLAYTLIAKQLQSGILVQATSKPLLNDL